MPAAIQLHGSLWKFSYLSIIIQYPGLGIDNYSTYDHVILVAGVEKQNDEDL